MSRPRSAPLDELTAREREVLELVATGLSNQEIGDRLGLAEKTIKHYMTSILGKLRVRSRVEAALLAYREGMARRCRARGTIPSRVASASAAAEQMEMQMGHALAGARAGVGHEPKAGLRDAGVAASCAATENRRPSIGASASVSAAAEAMCSRGSAAGASAPWA